MSNLLYKKKTEVLNHWISFVDEFQTSPSEFYSTLEHELSARRLPKMDFSTIELLEGGLLSEKRLYLRIIRERIIFDVCAAPFGTGFFFSCRTTELPNFIYLSQVISLIFLVCFFTWALVKLFGFIWGCIAMLSLLFVVVRTFRKVVASGIHDIDKAILKSPLFGSIYGKYFRKETYHRIDSRLCYLHVIPTLVKKLAEEATAAKGIKLIDQYAANPVLGDMYKSISPLPSHLTEPIQQSPRQPLASI